MPGMPSTPLAVEMGASDGSILRKVPPPVERVLLPAETVLDDVAHLETGMVGLDDLADRAARHHLADADRGRVGRRVAHAPAHVGVERKVDVRARAPGGGQAPAPQPPRRGNRSRPARRAGGGPGRRGGESWGSWVLLRLQGGSAARVARVEVQRNLRWPMPTAVHFIGWLRIGSVGSRTVRQSPGPRPCSWPSQGRYGSRST